jgi:hypothetical protein
VLGFRRGFDRVIAYDIACSVSVAFFCFSSLMKQGKYGKFAQMWRFVGVGKFAKMWPFVGVTEENSFFCTLTTRQGTLEGRCAEMSPYFCF